MLVKDNKIHSSYLISKYKFDTLLSDFNQIKIGEFYISSSYDVEIKSYFLLNCQVVLIGYIFDIRNGDLGEETILKNILESDNRYEELEFLNGRYNILIHDSNSTFVYSDASQLKPLFYNSQSELLSSHDELIKTILTYLDSDITRRPFRNSTELDFSRYVEINKFNPSLELDLQTYNFKRIYPRTVLIEKSAGDTFNELKPYLDESIKYISNQKNKIFLSITGGIDSRVSAALTNSFRDKVEYLTYTKPISELNTYTAKRIYQIDEYLTHSMKKNIPWNHTIINLYDYNVNSKHDSYLSKFVNSKHSYRLASYYKYEKRYSNALHIKSTVFGMGKADFPKELDVHSNSLDFYKKCIHGLPERFFEKYDFDKEASDYFYRNKITEGVTKNRHFFDLFHLESRMGNWHSTLTQETDPETEEFIFTNSRKIIDLIQQPSIEERRNFDLYKIIVNHYWPILLFFGINNKKNKNLLDLTKRNDTQNSHISSGVKFIKKDDMKVQFKDSGVLFQPSTKEIKKKNFYGFTLSNINKKSKIITLQSFYSNQKSTGKISVLIRQKNKNIIYDILELNDILTITLADEDMDVDIFYDDNYIKPSWQSAGRILVKIKELI